MKRKSKVKKKVRGYKRKKNITIVDMGIVLKESFIIQSI